MGICVGRSMWNNRYLGVQKRESVDENERAEDGERFGLTKVL